MSLSGKQQQRRQMLVHWDSTNTAPEYITQDAHLKRVCKTASSTNKQQQAVGCNLIHTMVNGRELILHYLVGVRWEICD